MAGSCKVAIDDLGTTKMSIHILPSFSYFTYVLANFFCFSDAKAPCNCVRATSVPDVLEEGLGAVLVGAVAAVVVGFAMGLAWENLGL